MARSLIQAYALAVCFTALMCLVIALGIAVYDLVQITAPSFTVENHALWQSNEHFLTYHPDKKGLPPQEIAHLRQADREAALANEQRHATQSLVFASIIIFIDVAIYVVHWQMAKRREPVVSGSSITPGATDIQAGADRSAAG